ncbi:MAG TPA: hypothetical protein VIL20_10365 [Sandaracinaceae bacterium]
MSKHASEGDYAELALAVYVEELAVSKRVLFVGDPTSPAPERLARSARSVDVVSTRSRVRGTRRGGRVASRRWPGPQDEGRWDLVVVPDLPGAGLASEAKIEEVARWLAPGGVLVAGTADPHGPAGTPSSLTYEALFDLVDPAFEHVRMLGQAPFAGYSVVDFAPASELEVTFDGSILEGRGESAERYYALCSDREIALDPYAVVQVPTAVAPALEARTRAERSASELAARLREQQDALDAANVHAEEIERELEDARGELDRAREELGRARERAERAIEERGALDARVRELEAELEALSREDTSEDYARLEAALRERGQEITELRVELERRGTLVRDLIEELREAREGRGAKVPPEAAAIGATVEWTQEELHRALHAQLDEAVQRAVTAEAEKAELAFRLDEVRGELAIAERRCAAELEELHRVEAALRGTVRGLNARLAEVIELYQLTQARLALAEDDRAAAEAKSQRLERELAELRERLELEIARARMAAPAPDEAAARLREIERRAAEREGELLGALMKAREKAAELAARERLGAGELERARGALAALQERVEGMRAGYEARIAELVRELDEVGGQAERALVTVGELRSRLEIAERTEASLRGELAGTKLRLADREQAVEALRRATTPAPARAASPPAEDARVVVAGRKPEPPPSPEALEAALAAANEENAALKAELEALRARAAQEEALRARVAELEAERRPAPATVEYARDGELEARIARLSAMLAARDGLVVRLQRELADAAERRAALERRLDECAGKLARAREELEAARAIAEVTAQESRREIDDLVQRLERTERERAQALEGLEEARAILEELASELPRREVGATAAGDADAATVRELRERIARLDAEAADREVLLRSLTAQLQERDDRIRALERLRAQGGGDGDAIALQQRLLEMEERVARLSEELEHERDARRRAEGRPS